MRSYESCWMQLAAIRTASVTAFDVAPCAPDLIMRILTSADIRCDINWENPITLIAPQRYLTCSLTKILKVDPLVPDVNLIREAAGVLRSGGTVVFPTETVYGLGANAFDDAATRKIFKAKGRPGDNPLIVHISDFGQLYDVCSEVPASMERIAKKFWPGPLSVLLPRSPSIADSVTAGLPTVAVRMPAHPVALSLIRESGVPIAAPSANLSTKPSPTSASHAIHDLMERVDVIIDGGDTFFGVESTIIMLTDKGATILRPGPYSPDELASAFSEVEVSVFAQGEQTDRPLVPGMKYRHYAPSKPLLMVPDKETLVRLSNELYEAGLIHAVLCSPDMAKRVKGNPIILGQNEDLYEVARTLFSALREFDLSVFPFALVHAYPEHGIGLAIMNRLKKASGGIVVTRGSQVFDILRAAKVPAANGS